MPVYVIVVKKWSVNVTVFSE